MLPKLLELVAEEAKVSLGDDEPSGLAFASAIINAMCSRTWPRRLVAKLSAVLREVNLTPEEHAFAVARILRSLPDLEIEEIAPVVYQLLLFSIKGEKKTILEGIVAHHDRLHVEHVAAGEDILVLGLPHSQHNAGSPDRLLSVEGTIMLHLTFAIQQDQELGKLLVKMVKASPQLQPFGLALALSLTRVHRYQDAVLDTLKARIIVALKTQEMLQTSPFLTSAYQPLQIPIKRLFLGVVDNSRYGWDHVVHGLVQLGLTLVDHYAYDPVPQWTPSPAHMVCQLGSAMLLQTFHTHEIVRAEILDQLLSRIITKRHEAISHLIGTLARWLQQQMTRL